MENTIRRKYFYRWAGCGGDLWACERYVILSITSQRTIAKRLLAAQAVVTQLRPEQKAMGVGVWDSLWLLHSTGRGVGGALGYLAPTAWDSVWAI